MEIWHVGLVWRSSDRRTLSPARRRYRGVNGTLSPPTSGVGLISHTGFAKALPQSKAPGAVAEAEPFLLPKRLFLYPAASAGYPASGGRNRSVWKVSFVLLYAGLDLGVWDGRLHPAARFRGGRAKDLAGGCHNIF